MAITDDLLRFDNYPCMGCDAQNSNGETPDAMPVAEPMHSNHVPDHSLLRVCSVFKAQDSLKLNDYTSIVIDSGASGTVCRKIFVSERYPVFREHRSSSGESFKFGDSRHFVSCGEIDIPCSVTLCRTNGSHSHRILLRCDIVEAEIPILLSRAALVKMKVSISFDENKLMVGKAGSVRLSTTTSGHICLPAEYLPDELVRTREEEWCFPMDSEDKKKRMRTDAELLKIQTQLGHAPSRRMISLMNNGGFLVGEELADAIISKCGCASLRMKTHASVANAHLSPYPGYAIFIDVIYAQQHTGHAFPHLFMMDSFSRFMVCVAAKNIKTKVLVMLFEIHWVGFLGRPRFMIRDGGPGLIGAERLSYGEVHGITLVCNPTNNSYQMGSLERHVGLFKEAVGRVKSLGQSLANYDAVGLSCLVRNNSLIIGSGVTPSQVVFGKCDYLGGLDQWVGVWCVCVCGDAAGGTSQFRGSEDAKTRNYRIPCTLSVNA